MIGFLEKWAALLIALVALAQPWVVILWKKFVRLQKIDVYEAGPVEIGFTSVGPMVGLMGTLRAINRDVFIRDMQVRIVRESDNAEHNLEWSVFRFPGTGSGNRPAFETCSGFLLSEDSAFRYDIGFSEPGPRKEIREVRNRLNTAWMKNLDAVGLGPALRDASQGPGVGNDLRPKVDSAFEKFTESDVFMETLRLVERMFFWEPGDYRLTLGVTTARPARMTKHSWRFALSEEESGHLRTNIWKSLREVCGREHGSFTHVYSAYEDQANEQ